MSLRIHIENEKLRCIIHWKFQFGKKVEKEREWLTRQGNRNFVHSAKGRQGVPRLATKELFEIIRSMTCQQGLQEARRFLHRWSFSWNKWKRSCMRFDALKMNRYVPAIVRYIFGGGKLDGLRFVIVYLLSYKKELLKLYVVYTS